MGYVRQLNEGVSRIYEYMEKSMLSSPEYEERNNNIYLTLRNKISKHSKTIAEIVMNKITGNWSEYNDTQQKIIQFLFRHHQGTIEQLEEYTKINKNTIRGYLNKYIEDGIVERKSKKQRDINAKYAFKKY